MTKLIEFSGTPDAGKTTLVNSLYAKFSNEGKKVINVGATTEISPLSLPDALPILCECS